MYHLSTFGRPSIRLDPCGNFLQDWRFFPAFILLALIVFFSPVKSSGQDLGALARAEQARKAALPEHPNHVYTNDDLSRPQILAPEDKSIFDAKRSESAPVLAEVPPDAEAPAAPEVSLGEIARQYRQRKLAQQLPSEDRPTVAKHVYTDDEMLRPTILTQGDRAAYEAALKKPVPAVQIQITAQTAFGESPAPEAPLGDIARTAYQDRERSQEARAPSKFHFPGTWAALASPVPRKRIPVPSPKVVAITRPVAPRHAKKNLDEVRRVRFEAITVRRGDSLWKLARVYLGHGALWRTLLKANPQIRNPDRLKIGMELRI